MRRAGRISALCVGLSLVCASTAGATGLRATFDGGAQGWLDQFGNPANWSSSDGHPGGNLVENHPSEQFIQIFSDGWAGNRRSALGGIFSVDLRLDNASADVSVRLDCASCGEGAIIHHFPGEADQVWRDFLVPLRASSWRIVAAEQPPATRLTMARVLADLDTVGIALTEGSIGSDDFGHFDNVTLAANVARRLTIAYSDGAFSGRLSPGGGCARRQRVLVYRKKLGPDAKVGADKTNRRGKYLVREPNAKKGSYYAKAKASFAAGTGNCLAAKSKAERVG
jgi:hypothetical protein